MNIDWGWVAHLLEGKSLEILEDEAGRLEKLAERAEKEAEIRKRMKEAREKIKATRLPSPLSNISKGPLLLLGLVVLLIVFLVIAKSCG